MRRPDRTRAGSPVTNLKSPTGEKGNSVETLINRIASAVLGKLTPDPDLASLRISEPEVARDLAHGRPQEPSRQPI